MGRHNLRSFSLGERQVMGKWDYIAKISEILGVNNNFTIHLLNRYDKPNVQEITEQEAKEYYEEIVKNRNKILQR